MKAVIYIHGKLGSAKEAEHYRTLFPEDEVIGLDYKGSAPAQIAEEIKEVITEARKDHDEVVVIANSTGAYYLMNAGVEDMVNHAYFISPVVDLEKVIRNVMLWADVSEEELQEKGYIRRDEGEDLSWSDLRYAIEHPVHWDVPTDVLYGFNDTTTPLEVVRRFVREHNASLLVMQDGGHWFHTGRQLAFVAEWIRSVNEEQ